MGCEMVERSHGEHSKESEKARGGWILRVLPSEARTMGMALQPLPRKKPARQTKALRESEVQHQTVGDEGKMIGRLHQNILATHEEAQDTSLGPWPGDDVRGVALPCVGALRKTVEVGYGKTLISAIVLDVGPWVVDDKDYVFGDERPRAESYIGKPPPPRGLRIRAQATVAGKVPMKCNGAGIDLFPGAAKALGIPIGKNVYVKWRFI